MVHVTMQSKQGNAFKELNMRLGRVEVTQQMLGSVISILK